MPNEYGYQLLGVRPPASAVSRYVQRPPLSIGGGYQLQGVQSDQPDVNAYLPTPGEIRTEVGEQRKSKPWYSEIFDFMDQLTGGAAIRGFLKGLGDTQPEGAAIKGFFSNLPLIHYVTGEDVTFADIREAWGDTNARDGVKNAIWNTLGDIASNPFMLFGSPFAVTKAGMAAATLAGATRYAQGAKMSAEALKLAEGLTSIGKGLETGQRAMYTFNMFGKELFSLGKIPQGVNPLGFRSMYVPIGNMLDSFFSLLHSHPLLKPVSGVFTFATGIGDPLKRAMFGGATRAAEAARNNTIRSLTSILEASTSDEFRNWIAKDSGGYDAILTMAQVGADRADLRAAFAEMVDKPYLWIGNGRKNDLLKNDPHFVALWTKAWEEVAQPKGMSAPAIRELYEKFGVPLEPEMLAHADLPARYGIEASILDKPTFAETVAGGVGTGTTEEMAKRAAIGQEVRGRIKGVIEGAHQKTLSSWDYIQQQVADGKISWDDIHGYLKGHADAMEAASEINRMGGILGTVMEPAVGPFVHAVMNPRLAKVIDKQLFRGSEEFGGKKAINIISGFMKDQHYASLTTAERNAIFWELGTKLTGFKPLKELAAKEFASHSLIDRIEAKIFDLPFIKALRTSGGPGDVDAANLFLTNPVLNDYHLIFETAQQHGARALFQSVFKGPMVVDVVDATDVNKILKYEQQGLRGVIPNPEPRKILETRAVGSFSQDVMDAERSAAASEARARISEHTKERIAAQVTDYPGEHRHLMDSWRNISENSPESALVSSTADNVGVVQAKVAARDLRDTTAKLDALKAMKAGGQMPEELAAHAAYEEGNIRMEWADQGAKTQAEIQARLDQRLADMRQLAERKRMLETEAKLYRSSAQDPELRSWQESHGLDIPVERGRLRQLETTLRRGIKDDQALLAGKYKNEDSFVVHSIPEKIDDLRMAREAASRRLIDSRANLKDSADNIGDMIDLVTAQEKFRGRRGAADIARARAKSLSAQEMNTEIAVLHEAQTRGALALDQVTPSMRSNILGRPGTKIHFFKTEDWDAVEKFWAHWSHADDWGQNAIVKSLRTMRNVWAPYTAVNGLGLATRFRDAIQNHLMYEFGGAWSSIPSRIRSYMHSDQIARGAMLGVDDVAKKEAFAAGKFIPKVKAPGGPESYSYPELLQFLQNRGVNGAASMHGETIVNAGDMMTLAQVRPFKPAEFLEKGSIAGKETFLPKAVTDLPSAILPLRKPQDSVYGRWGLHMAQFVDDRSRVAGFLGKLDQGATLDEAADFALKWGYDSRRNMTTLERQRLATFIPFYSWAKFAISRSVETFFKHPGRIAWIDKGRQNFMKAVLPGDTEANADDIEAILPEYIAQSYGVPYKNGAKGPSFFLLGSWLPTGEMQQMVSAFQGGAKGLANYVGAKLHPALGTAIETAFNHEFYKGKDLEQFEGQHDEFMGMSISKRWGMNLLQNFRFLYELDRQNLLGISESQSLRHGTATEDDPSYLTRLTQSAFGIMPKTYPLSVEQAARTAKRNEMEQLDRLSGLLKSRVQHPERKVSNADAESLRELLNTGAARLARIEGLSSAFPPDQPAVKKKRRKFGPLTESLTP